MYRAGRWLGVIIFTVLILGGAKSAAAATCCLYNPKTDAPAWMLTMPDAATVTASKKNILCTTVNKLPWAGKFVGTDGATAYEGWEYYEQACDTIAAASQAQAAMATTKCCRIVRSSQSICINKTETNINCAQKAANKMQAGDVLVADTTACGEIDACKTTTGTSGGSATASATPTASNGDPSQVLAGKSTVWKKAECLSVKNTKGEARFAWIPPKDNPNVAEGSFCYAVPEPMNLSISIGSVVTIKNIPHYINVLYKYVLGVGVLLAVLILIISGFQWMVSGVAGAIKSAKDRMFKAALGLVLLFGAHLLLYTVNPQLVQLRTPPILAVRPESLDLSEKSPECNPSAADGGEAECAKKGTNLYCKPTGKYIGDKCAAQATIFVGTIFAAGAVAFALPLAVNAGIVAAGQAATSFASWVTTSFATPQAFGAMVARTAVQAGAEQVVESGATKFGKSMAPILLTLGLTYAAGKMLEVKPADGYCVPVVPATDGQVCRQDKLCQSGKCLLTSFQCGGKDTAADKLGICVSGQLRQPCSKTDSKYGCNNGAHCAGKSGKNGEIGFCSDGTQIGMACDDKQKCAAPMVCVNESCREAGYFDSTGWMFKAGAACFTSLECGVSDKGSNFAPPTCLKIDPKTKLAKMVVAGPLKNNNAYNKNGDLLEELQAPGKCVFNNSYSPSGKSLAAYTYNPKDKGQITQPCFINVETCNTADCKNNLGVITGTGAVLPAKYNNGIRLRTVGCGLATQVLGSMDAKPLGPGYCAASLVDFISGHLATYNAVLGSCVYKKDFSASGQVALRNYLGSTTVVALEPDTTAFVLLPTYARLDLLYAQ